MTDNFNDTFHKVTREIFCILAKVPQEYKIEFSYFEESCNLKDTTILKTNNNLESKTNRNSLRYRSDFFAFLKRYHSEDIFAEVLENASSQWQAGFLRSAENARIIAIAYQDHINMLGVKNNLKGYAKSLKNDDLYYFLKLLKIKLPDSLFQDRNKINYDYDFKNLHEYICNQRDFLSLVLSTIDLKNRDLADRDLADQDQNINDNNSNDNQDYDENIHTNQDNSNDPTSSTTGKMENNELSDAQEDNNSHNPTEKANSHTDYKWNNNQENQDVSPNSDQDDTSEHHQVKINTTYEFDKYFAFTKAYDREVISTNLESFQGEALNLRKKLDAELNSITNSNINLLALKLQRKLQSKKNNTRNDNLSYGTLNTKKLYKAITSPLSPNIYYQETNSEEIDTTVTILVDNSGSQMGNPITTSCVSCDLLAKVFARCNISCEILGFTTSHWQGGLSFQEWQKHIKLNPHKLQQGNNAGRLNDLLHIIYKPANKKYNLMKNHIAMMLKRGILKENIDGEALEWAYKRILTRSEQRKIILVISDGTPADDTTQTYNHKLYLINHLKEVIQTITNDNTVELLAIGMGFDIKSLYKNSLHIEDHTNLGQTIMNLFLDYL